MEGPTSQVPDVSLLESLPVEAACEIIRKLDPVSALQVRRTSSTLMTYVDACYVEVPSQRVIHLENLQQLPSIRRVEGEIIIPREVPVTPQLISLISQRISGNLRIVLYTRIPEFVGRVVNVRRVLYPESVVSFRSALNAVLNEKIVWNDGFLDLSLTKPVNETYNDLDLQLALMAPHVRELRTVFFSVEEDPETGKERFLVSVAPDPYPFPLFQQASFDQLIGLHLGLGRTSLFLQEPEARRLEQIWSPMETGKWNPTQAEEIIEYFRDIEESGTLGTPFTNIVVLDLIIPLSRLDEIVALFPNARHLFVSLSTQQGIQPIRRIPRAIPRQTGELLAGLMERYQRNFQFFQ